MATTDFKNPQSVLSSIKGWFKTPRTKTLKYPKPVILASENRPGLSPKKIAAEIIRRQSEAGLPVGPLSSGEISPDELMERIRVEEIIKAIMVEMKTDVVIKPGALIQASGGNVGGPIQVVGTVVGYSSGLSMAS
jgi:hypothetical protein